MFASHPPAPDRAAALFEGEGETLEPLDRDALMRAFEAHGAVLVRGAQFSVDEFRDFARSICPISVYNESPGRIDFGGDGSVQSVNRGSVAFPLHPELSREPWRPDACFFGCLTPPAAQGQTTYCDGIALAEALPAHVRQAMENRSLIYIKPASPETLAYWLGSASPSDQQLANPPEGCPYRFRRVGPQVIRYFVRPLLAPTRFGDGLAFANFLMFARDHLRIGNFPCLDDGSPVPDEWMREVRSAAEQLTQQVDWRAGDLLMLDNSRFMHGRRTIVDADNRLIATYFGYLDGVDPMPGEPTDPVWRRENFRPPEVPAST